MNFANLQMCTGCGACIAACPKSAIEFQKDIYEKRIPLVVEERCINCGICAKTCPINNDFFIDRDKYQKCYAMQAKNKIDREGCSSGGVATIISNYINKNNGKVFGCSFDEELNLEYIQCNTKEEIELIKGSKYVQSNLTSCFGKIKQCLETGKKVLVIGVPCQIAGIRGYLRKEYENLYLIDLICHGNPPVEYLKEHIKNMYKGQCDDVKFRGNKGFVLSLLRRGKIVYSIKSTADEYYSGFLSGMIYRDNCYKCPYASLNRVSDITIGDFWGLDKNTTINKFRGNVSVVIPNTTKGEKLLNQVKNNFIWEERSLEEAIRENEQLRKPMSPDEDDRNIFLKYYPKLGFDSALRKTKLYRKKILVSICKEKMLQTSIGKNLQSLWRKIKK